MKESVRTTKLKLVGDHSKLQQIATSYKDAANWLSKIIYDRNKIESPAKLSREFYGTVREKFQLPSQVTCSLFRHVVSTYRTAKSNKRWKLAKFKKLNVPLCWKRDFNLSSKGLTIWSQPFKYQHGPIPDGKWSDSKLKKIGNNWYIILSVKVQIPESKTEGTILGIDAGIKNLLTCIDPKTNKTLYVKMHSLNHKREQIRQRRAKVASVGTRSAKRLLRRLSGKEAAVTQEMCHLASKQVVAFAQSVNARSIVVEDLGESVRRSSKKKGKQLRSDVHRWPFGKCQFFLQYKAEQVGITFEKVNPKYTSQACTVCGHTEDSNRKGLRFKCKSCGYQDNADRNGAKNIALKSILQQLAVEERAINQLAYSDESSHDGSVTNLASCGRGS
jgi:IS605 OrfB family transposase